MADIERELVRELVRASAFALATARLALAAGGNDSDAFRAIAVELDPALRSLGVDLAPVVDGLADRWCDLGRANM